MGMRFHMTVEEAGKQDFLRLSEELEIHRKVTNQPFSVISHIQVPDLDHQRRMRESWQQRVNNSVFQIINSFDYRHWHFPIAHKYKLLNISSSIHLAERKVLCVENIFQF